MPAEVAAIAFDSQMAGIGSIDEDFRPATRFDSWLDMRCQPYIEAMDRQAGDRITELTGCAPTCDHGPKILWWMHERPADFARIAKFVTPAGYVAGTMAGLKADQAFMDYTFIHFTGFSDSKAVAWSPELCDRFGLDRSKLPEIVEPWRVVGEVTPAAARDFGLAPGTAVAAGCGDTAACALGAGAVVPGMVFDSAGTAAVLAACTDQFVADRKHRALLCMHSVIPGVYNPLAYIAGGGIALRWFRDQFYNTLRGAEQPREGDLYEAMIAWAETIPPGADGLFFSPHLGGRICPSSAGDARGVDRLLVGPQPGALLPGAAGEHRLRVRVLPGHPGRSASRPGAGRGARGRRRRAQRGVESDQGRRARSAVSKPGAFGARHLGRGADRGQGGGPVRRSGRGGGGPRPSRSANRWRRDPSCGAPTTSWRRSTSPCRKRCTGILRDGKLCNGCIQILRRLSKTP